MTDVDSLKDLVVDLTPWLHEKLEKLREYNNFDWDPVFDGRPLQDMLEQADAYRLSDRWYARFGPNACYWCGILSYYPWYYITENPEKYGYWEEEDIWNEVMRHHILIDTHQGLRARWQFNPRSRLNGWLRTWARDNEVIINMDTLLWFVTRAVIDLDWDNDRYCKTLEWIEVGRCPKCDFWTSGENYRCWECGSELLYGDAALYHDAEEQLVA